MGVLKQTNKKICLIVIVKPRCLNQHVDFRRHWGRICSMRLSWLSAVASNLWSSLICRPVTLVPPPSLHGVLSLSLSMPKLPSSYSDTSHWIRGDPNPLSSHSNLIISAKILFPIRSYSQVPGVRLWTSLGEKFNPQQH